MSISVGKASHLAARFFTSLSPAPPSVEAEVWVEDRLLPGERALWVQLGNQDRRHSAAVAQRFAELDPSASRALVAGAILHDVGKIECRLGTFSRVAATLVGPHGKRFRAYHDHEEIGAAMAEAAGSDPATVELVAGRGPWYPNLRACDHA
jgi:HD domain